MIYKFTVHTRPGPQRLAIEHLAAELGLPDLDLRRTIYLEVDRPLVDAELETLKRELGNPLTERVCAGEPMPPGRSVQVAYKISVVDNEDDSLVYMGDLLGIPVRAGKVATTYVSDDPRLPGIIAARRFNPSIEALFTEEPTYETLSPRGEHTPAAGWDLRGLDDEALLAIGRSGGRSLDRPRLRQLQRIQLETGQDRVTDVLLEAVDARWSDHCSHTTWRSLGHLLRVMRRAAEATGNPNILSMFEDNAGVWDFYDGWGIAIKAETHNGPSAISAYFGQLTKLGGVLRDILGTGLGADPIGSFEYTATGLPEAPPVRADRPGPRRIAAETIRAIKEYGNTFGVPMMWAHMSFHPRYAAKPFALGGSIGLIPKAAAAKGRPRPGDLVVLIGGLTGNDGIHGASASSAGAAMDQAAVQIGAPLEEVAFRQAILDLRDAGCLRALTDVGGAGLNSAVGELGEACGVWLNTARVPLKTKGLPMWRILLSESQERMILVVKPERLGEARRILDRHEVRTALIGRFTDRGRYQVVHDPALDEAAIEALDELPLSGELGIDVPYELLDYEPEQVPVPPPPPRRERGAAWPSLGPSDLADELPRLLGHADVCDQRYAIEQYDASVQGRSAYGPLFGPGDGLAVESSYYASTPIYGSDRTAVFTTCFRPALFAAHPIRAARQCMLGVVGTLVLAGAARRDICLCDNFYTPHLEEGARYWLAGMVHEIAQLSVRLGTPFISGKDSSAGSVPVDEGVIHVPPAVFFSALGKLPSVRGLRPNRWTRPGNLLVRVGLDTPSAAGTVAAEVLGLDANDVDEVPVDEALRWLEALEALSLTQAPSGWPIGAGGALAALVRGTLGSDLGAVIEGPRPEELLREHRVGAIIEVPPDQLDTLPPGLRPRVIGRVGGPGRSLVLDGTELLTEPALEAWLGTFQGRIG